MDQQTKIMKKNRKEASNGVFGFLIITLFLMLLFCLVIIFVFPDLLNFKPK
tara:strand:- start:2515 stop:2667 length:153 start_codon:yes stop_codon:yes gene_type:complete